MNRLILFRFKSTQTDLMKFMNAIISITDSSPIHNIVLIGVRAWFDLSALAQRGGFQERNYCVKYE